jgi:tRNA (cytosine49-C5)-methyltransferase
VANDTSYIRNYKLTANLQIQGVTNTSVMKFPGQIIWQKYPEYFDRVLVDVPCTMEGRINCDNPKSFGFWSTGKIKELAEIQKWLLRSAISSLKPGGIAVYSTCTLTPEENEGIIDWILKKEKDAIKIDKIKLPNLEFDPPVIAWGEKKYNPEVEKTVRIKPNLTMEGFFIAKITKLKSTIPASMKNT